MKKKSILNQLLLPIITIVCALAVCLSVLIVVVFTKSYEQEVFDKSQDKTRLAASEIATFLDGAYGIAEELSVNPSILTMQTDIQTPVLEDCVKRNPYFELLYIQGTDGMQTGRSSGELADRSARWWFTQMMEDKKAFISKSYYSVNTGMPCASIFLPMYREEKLAGIFAADMKLDYLQSIIEDCSNLEKEESSFVIDGEGVVVAHPDSLQIEELYNYKTRTKTESKKDGNGEPVTDADGNILTEEKPFELSQDYQNVISEVMNGASGCRKIKNEGRSYYISYASVPLKGESGSWSVLTVQKASSAMAMVYRIIFITVAAAVCAIAAAVFVITLLARRLTRPIASITSVIGNASDGDFTMRADESSQNEIGKLSKSFNKMIEKMSGILTKITTFSSEVVQSSGYLKKIEEEIDSIHMAVREISDGTVGQNQDVERVVMRTTELEVMFSELKAKSSMLLDDAQNVILSGESGSKSVGKLRMQNEDTTETMLISHQKIQSLEARSKKISNIVNTINGISSQTALLALNASIEAARAGEMGKGFAVVAESIGKLAADSTAATEDIESMISELCRDINDAVTSIQSMKEGIEGQSEVVSVVQETFEDFKLLAEKTLDSVSEMEELVVEMHKCDRSVVHAIERIRDISGHTEELTVKVAEALEEETKGIRFVAGRIDDLSAVSEEMEQEMTKFKLAD